jgi:hypothetical protein
MPNTMISNVAEANTLWAALPTRLSGPFSADEMAQGEENGRTIDAET